MAEIAAEVVGRGQATEHARVVLTTLREAVGEKEWRDTTAQLPGEYRICDGAADLSKTQLGRRVRDGPLRNLAGLARIRGENLGHRRRCNTASGEPMAASGEITQAAINL